MSLYWWNKNKLWLIQAINYQFFLLLFCESKREKHWRKRSKWKTTFFYDFLCNFVWACGYLKYLLKAKPLFNVLHSSTRMMLIIHHGLGPFDIWATVQPLARCKGFQCLNQAPSSWFLPKSSEERLGRDCWGTKSQIEST